MPCTFLILFFLSLEDFSGSISPLLEVPLSEKRKWRRAGGLNGFGREEEEEGLTLGASFLKPDSPQIPLCYSSTAFPGL